MNVLKFENPTLQPELFLREETRGAINEALQCKPITEKQTNHPFKIHDCFILFLHNEVFFTVL